MKVKDIDLQVFNEAAVDSNTNCTLNSPNASESKRHKQADLKYGAQDVIQLFIPVSLCMFFVVTSVNLVNYKKTNIFFLYTPFHEKSSDPRVKIWNALLNTLILMSIVVMMTIILIILYKKRFYKIIHCWLILSSFMLLFIFSFLYLKELLRVFNMPIDYPTVILIIWNFGVVGMLAIHWHGPLLLQQAYLIFVSALMALVFIKYLPNWTAWYLLAAFSIWDMIAVLTPKGPLRMLVETANKREEQLFPALIYSSTIIYTYMAINDGNILSLPPTEVNDDNCIATCSKVSVSIKNGLVESNLVTPPKHNKSKVQIKNGIKLGLGDFIFYSVLIGKASNYNDWPTTIACFLAILIGLSLTLILLTLRRKVLPALPISITLGLIFCFTTNIMVKPLIEKLTVQQIFL